MTRAGPRRARARLGGTAVALGTLLVASAHVGTSNAYFEGAAGPYPIRVIVRTPGVIPGLAEVTVRVLGDALPSRITVRPLRWDAGLEGAPPPDTARAVPGEPGLYAAELWLMTTGSYSVRVDVTGEAGEGAATVPVNALAERRLEMNRLMAAALIGAGVFLFVGAITIFGAAVRESVVEPGAAPPPGRRRAALVAMGAGAVVIAALLWGGWSWWGAVDRAYRAGIFRPLETAAAVDGAEGAPRLTLRIVDPSWRGRSWTPLIPDHGKLMHMFLVAEDGLAAFAHLHPAPVDSSAFATALPPLPAGGYRLYADIVHEDGFAETLVDTVALAAASPAADAAASGGAGGALDPDDSWAALPPHGAAAGSSYTLPSGRRMAWVSGRDLRADEEASLAFRVTEPDGAPAALEPYMGMLSHAVVTNPEGSLFVHVHPAGSISMAAMARFAAGSGAAAGLAAAG
ncbi:MAG TPA: hypothetical protein VFQ22_02065, partial [Longimicrobiales bacterium]|nr:hypothetical protein [Longimicrobiales bacterium]